MALLTSHNNPDSGVSSHESTLSQEKDILDIVGMEFAENDVRFNDKRLSEITAGNVTVENTAGSSILGESQSTGDDGFGSGDRETTSLIDKPADVDLLIDSETGEAINLQTGETVTTEDDQEEITEIIEEPAKKVNATSSKIKKIGLWGIVAVGAYFLLKK